MKDFMLGFLGLAVILQLLLVSHLDSEVSSSLQVLAQVRYENTQLQAQADAVTRRVNAMLPLVTESAADMAGLEYQMDLIVNASRTGWWSQDVIALLGREYLYRREVKELLDQSLYSHVNTNPFP